MFMLHCTRQRKVNNEVSYGYKRHHPVVFSTDAGVTRMFQKQDPEAVDLPQRFTGGLTENSSHTFKPHVDT